MAIFTQTGCKIDITGFNYNSGAIEIKYRTGHFDDVAIYELKADGGTEEIQETIKNLKGVACPIQSAKMTKTLPGKILGLVGTGWKSCLQLLL